MKDIDYILKKFSVLTNVSMVYNDVSDNSMICSGNLMQEILSNDVELKEILMKSAEQLSAPVIYLETDRILFSCIKISETGYLFVGPVCMGKYDLSIKHAFYLKHNLELSHEVTVPQENFIPFVELLSLLYYMLADVQLTYDDITSRNNLNMTLLEIDQKRAGNIINQYEENTIHHTYIEEKKWSDAIREGNVDGVKKYGSELRYTTSELSQKAVTHSKYLAICTVTIATRAAIEGGVDPIAAYEVSDILIKKLDVSNNITELSGLIDGTGPIFARMVQQVQRTQKYSTYIEQCKWYINNNYRNNLHLAELSEYIGINGSYLSHLFKEVEGITMKEFLNRVRIERAENLLRYANSSLAEICDYVGFSSQSYFGKIFKKHTGLTPQSYRNVYKNREFLIEKNI